VVKTSSALGMAGIVAIGLALGACGPAPSGDPTAPPARPAVQIDPTWGAANGQWTFTGSVDPVGDPTDVILEIGPGPITARVFDRRVAVAQALTEAGPLSISTTDIPEIPEICVRFAATNSAGTSYSTPLCVPHDTPSIVVDSDPPVTTFVAPAFGSTIAVGATSYTVSWTEADEGTGVSRRSLQRQVALDSSGVCGTFENDGPAVSDASPVAVSDLLDGHCYQWIQSLSDRAGNTGAVTSGTVRVDLGGS
jgi:hypothetical protein